VADFFVSLGNAVVDRSADELIGAVIIALALSLAMAGLYCLGRRSLRENMTPIIVLMLVANLVSMCVGAGYLALVRKKVGRPLMAGRFGSVAGSESMWTDAIFRAADLNRDGRITGEEASLAADQFVRRADSSGRGAIDPQSLDRAISTTGIHARSWASFGPDRSEHASKGHSTKSRSHQYGEPLAAPIRPEPDARDRVSGADPAETPDEPAP